MGRIRSGTWKKTVGLPLPTRLALEKLAKRRAGSTRGTGQSVRQFAYGQLLQKWSTHTGAGVRALSNFIRGMEHRPVGTTGQINGHAFVQTRDGVKPVAEAARQGLFNPGPYLMRAKKILWSGHSEHEPVFVDHVGFVLHKGNVYLLDEVRETLATELALAAEKKATRQKTLPKTTPNPKKPQPILGPIQRASGPFVLSPARFMEKAKQLGVHHALMEDTVEFLERASVGSVQAVAGKNGAYHLLQTKAGPMWLVDAVYCGQLDIGDAVRYAKHQLSQAEATVYGNGAAVQTTVLLGGRDVRVDFVRTQHGLALVQQALAENWVRANDVQFL